MSLSKKAKNRFEKAMARKAEADEIISAIEPVVHTQNIGDFQLRLSKVNNIVTGTIIALNIPSFGSNGVALTSGSIPAEFVPAQDKIFLWFSYINGNATIGTGYVSATIGDVQLWKSTSEEPFENGDSIDEYADITFVYEIY